MRFVKLVPKEPGTAIVVTRTGLSKYKSRPLGAHQLYVMKKSDKRKGRLKDESVLAIGIRRNMTNLSAVGFQFASLIPVSKSTVVRSEILTQAASLCKSIDFFCSVRSVLGLAVPEKYQPVVGVGKKINSYVFGVFRI